MNDREFAAALRGRDAILILSHLRPDGDTLGSGAALCSALRRMGKTAYLFPNPETTARYLPYVAQFFAPADFAPRAGDDAGDARWFRVSRDQNTLVLTSGGERLAQLAFDHAQILSDALNLPGLPTGNVNQK